jgi:CheY-like chemotaxis protein
MESIPVSDRAELIHYGPATSIARAARGQAGRPPGAYRVLCVDDDRDSAETLAVILGLCGFDARACTDGTAALRAFHEFGPHACVLDLRMPRMDGFELARRLRATAGDRPLVLLTASGLAGPEVPARAAAAGFDAVYAKPVDPQAFVDLLDVMLVRTFPSAPTE